jgi:hypothetical protein
MLTGLADAAISDWSVKAFAWTGVLMLYALIVSYEFILMPTPPKPFLQAVLFVVSAPMGLLPAHHFTWLIVSVMLGKPIEIRLWIAPNMYVSLYTYTVAMLLLLTLYLAYLIVASLHPCEQS